MVLNSTLIDRADDQAVSGAPEDWFVYILLNEAGTAYTGIAKDVAARLAKHNAGAGAKFTRGRGPWRIAHREGPMRRGEALRRELAIKCDTAFKARLKAAQRRPAFHIDAGRLPAGSGAYVLLIELKAEVTINLPRRRETVLAAGRYLDCGSAKGPGGIKARVARHMRRDKIVRWHVDQLTTAGQVVGTWVFPGGTECALVQCLTGLSFPFGGFGSSDCRTCPSHLLALPEGMQLPQIETLLGR